MKKIKILHVASFNGNIGDNVSHNGFHLLMQKAVGEKNIEYTMLEMREFYQSWNKRSFDSEEFVELCNAHDLVVIGGGNYFEAKWDYSHTGTNFNISAERLERIKTPIFFNSIGVDLLETGSEQCQQRFYDFLRRISPKKKFFLSLRNDGSYEIVKRRLESKYMKEIRHVWDDAFFAEKISEKNRDDIFAGMDPEHKIVGINICKDMKELRWGNVEFGYEEYVQELTQSLNQFMEKYKEYDLIFFPHIYSDLEAINDVLALIKDEYRRIRVRVAPLLTGQDCEKTLMRMYRNCEFVLAMRFHSNVISLIQEVPAIGLNCHQRVESLYQELELTNRMVKVNSPFQQSLLEQMNNTIDNIDKIKSRLKEKNDEVLIFREKYVQDIQLWLQENRL